MFHNQLGVEIAKPPNNDLPIESRPDRYGDLMLDEPSIHVSGFSTGAMFLDQWQWESLVFEPFPWASGPSRSRIKKVKRLLASLDLRCPDDATVLRLRYLDDLSQVEVGEAMGLSQPAVWARLARAVRRAQIIAEATSYLPRGRDVSEGEMRALLRAYVGPGRALRTGHQVDILAAYWVEPVTVGLRDYHQSVVHRLLARLAGRSEPELQAIQVMRRWVRVTSV